MKKILGILLLVICVLPWVYFSFKLWLGYHLTLIMWVGGFFGFIISIVVIPGFVIFPFIFWIVEGVFPIGYFILFGESIVLGMMVSFGFYLVSNS